MKVLPNGSTTRGLTISNDGSLIYVTNSGSNHLVVFDATTLAKVETYKLGEAPRSILIRSRPFDTRIPVSTIALSDFDSDGFVGFEDFLLFAQAFGLSAGDGGFDAKFDLDGSGSVDFVDFLSFAQAFGRSAKI